MRRIVLPLLVLSQFFCTSLWFAGNAVINNVVENVAPAMLALVTSSVQFGFIIGTLCFALLTIADRFSPSRVFLISAIFASLSNLAIVVPGLTLEGVMLLRLLTGFFLAGIYPVGMKIAADHFDASLGKSLGYLVGALVLGTAFPHLIKASTFGMSWKIIILSTSILAVAGGLITWLFIPDGPYRKKAPRINFSASFQVLRYKPFRKAAVGYFGHCWELYAFWAFVPQILLAYQKSHPTVGLNVPMLSFMIIAFGGLGCVGSGFLSRRISARKIVVALLLLSCLFCLLSPLFFYIDLIYVLVFTLILWGIIAVSDSPLFSKLMAEHAPPESRGAALTLANCIGFSITIISIQLLGNLQAYLPIQYVFMFLATGPVIGLYALLKSD